MSDPHQWPEPAWLASVAPADREAARLKFMVALAALYHNPEGSPIQMSRALGLHENSLSAVKSRGKIGAELAVRIEQALGRDLFPWHVFLPDLVLGLE